MRSTTYLGLILGLTVIFLAVLLKGADLTIFANFPALLVTFGGTVAAITLSSSGSTIGHAGSAMSKLLWSPILSRHQVASQLVQIARQAKSQGIATIDPEKVALKDPFFVKGLHLVVDGTEPERIESLLRLESDILSEKRRTAERAFRLMGTYSPMFGLIGTLVGLISMLKGLTDPRAIGQGMSIALMATFYGVLFAGLVFLPLAGKVRTLDTDERLLRDQMMAGLLAIRLGENPEYLRETLEVLTQKETAA